MKMASRNPRWLKFLAFPRMVKHFNRLGQTLSLHSADSFRCLVIGRTSQRLEERIRQHVPFIFVAKAMCHQQQEPAKKPVETKHTMVLRSQSRGAAEKKTKSEDEASDDEASDDGALEIRKSDSGITRHLKESAECRDKVCPNLLKCFTILAKARNSSHLGFLEAIFIARRSPVLCSQTEFFRSLALF